MIKFEVINFLDSLRVMLYCSTMGIPSTNGLVIIYTNKIIK
jgi:hypothetical protein